MCVTAAGCRGQGCCVPRAAWSHLGVGNAFIACSRQAVFQCKHWGCCTRRDVCTRCAIQQLTETWGGNCCGGGRRMYGGMPLGAALQAARAPGEAGARVRLCFTNPPPNSHAAPWEWHHDGQPAQAASVADRQITTTNRVQSCSVAAAPHQPHPGPRARSVAHKLSCAELVLAEARGSSCPRVA
jgi:hypothetical protein